MPASIDDRSRARQRDSYADVGARQRQALERAIAARTTPAERIVLQAVFYWTSTFSRNSDAVSLGRIAQAAGLWAGTARDCPREIQKNVATRLKRLAAVGAVVYQPGGQHRAKAGIVSLPEVEEGSMLTLTDGSMIHRLAGSARPPVTDAVRGVDTTRLGGSAQRVKGGRQDPISGVDRTPPHEELTRTKSEVRFREPRAHVDDAQVRSLAGRLEAATTTNPVEPELLERLCIAVVEVAVAHFAIAEVDECVAGVSSWYDQRPPQVLLSALDPDDECAELIDDPRWRALMRVTPFLLATAAASHNGTAWAQHVDEALAVTDWWRDHDMPEVAALIAVQRAIDDGLARPAAADAIARGEARDLGGSPPPFPKPPAQKMRPR